MKTDMNDKAEVEKRLWAELEQGRFGMLGADSTSDGGFHPMTAYAEPESKTIWFYTSKETELGRAAVGGVQAMFIAMAKDQDFQACIDGYLTVSHDTLHRDKYWSPMVSAWFAEGRTDPNVTLLAFACRQADVWVSDAGALKFGWEMTKAHLIGGEPDVGGRAHITFR